MVSVKGPQVGLQLRGLLRARRGPHAAADQDSADARDASRWSWCAEMRVAFFSPLPPARSGIADYSEALIEPLQAAGRAGGLLRRRPAVRSRALRRRALPHRQQRLPRFRLRDGAAASRRGGDARIEPAPPDRRPHDQARRLGRLRARVRVQRRRRRRARSPSACASWRSGPDYEGAADDAPPAGSVARRGRAQPVHAGRDARAPDSRARSR